MDQRLLPPSPGSSNDDFVQPPALRGFEARAQIQIKTRSARSCLVISLRGIRQTRRLEIIQKAADVAALYS